MALPTSPAALASLASEPAEDVAALTRRLAAAEDAAWAEAHARYAPRLFRYLLAASHGDESAACEALQGAFVRAVRHVKVFHTEEALWGWLTLLARHALADSRRGVRRWHSFLSRFFAAEPAPEENHVSTSDPLSGALETALCFLDPEDRSLLEQKYFTAATVREIAAAAGVSEKAIESRLTRARERLREKILELLRA